MLDPVSTGPPAVAPPSVAPPGAVASPSVAPEFEAMVLRPLIDASLPRGGAVFGEGLPGDTWRSMLVDALARDWAERGGTGIGDDLLSGLPGEQGSAR